MKIHILLGLSLSLSIFSCNKKSSTSSSPNDKTSANMCLALDNGSIPDPTPASRAGLALTNGDISLSSQHIAKTSSLSIHTNSARLASKAKTNGESPPFFIMYHICKKEDQNCLESNQWIQSPHFTINNIIGSPKGDLIVSTMLCVDDINFVATDDDSPLSKRCSDSEPCYCGKPVNTHFANNDDPNNNDKSLEALATQIHSRRDQLHKLAIRYQRDAQAYVRQCLPQINNTADLQTAQNINNLSSSDIAAISEAFDTRTFISQAQASLALNPTKLALAGSSSPSCPSGLAPSSNSASSGSLVPDTSLPAGANSKSASSSVNSISATSSSSATSTTKIASSTDTSSDSAVSPATESNHEPAWQKPVILSLGIAAVVAGAALVSSWTLERFSKVRMGDLLNVLADSKVGVFLRGARTIADLSQRVETAYTEMDRALREGNWQNFERARKDYRLAVMGGDSIGVGKTSLGLRAVFQKHLGPTALMPSSFEQGLAHLEQLDFELAKFSSPDGIKFVVKDIHILSDGNFTGEFKPRPLTDILTSDEAKFVDLENRVKDKFLSENPTDYKAARTTYLAAGGDPKKYPEIEESAAGSKKFKEGVYTLDGKKFTVVASGISMVDGKTPSDTKETFLKSWQHEIPRPDPQKILSAPPERTPNKESSKKFLVIGAITFASGISMIASTAQHLVQNTSPPDFECGNFAKTSFYWESQMASVLDTLNQAKADFAKKTN